MTRLRFGFGVVGIDESDIILDLKGDQSESVDLAAWNFWSSPVSKNRSFVEIKHLVGIQYVRRPLRITIVGWTRNILPYRGIFGETILYNHRRSHAHQLKELRSYVVMNPHTTM